MSKFKLFDTSEVIIDPKEGGIHGLKNTLEAARIRVQYYGERLTLRWLEDLMEQVEHIENEEETQRQASYDEGYELAEREFEDAKQEAEEAVKKYDDLRRSLRSLLEE